MLQDDISPITDLESKLLLQYANQSATNEQLTPELLSLIHSKGWFRALIDDTSWQHPVSLPELLALEEALARIDGSLGWTVTLCSGAGWFAGFTDEQTRKAFFSGPEVCIAGSGAIGGKAETAVGGYIISGYWKYATGAPYATAFTGNCTTDTGEVLAFLFKKEEITLHHTWNSMGMIATASHSFSAETLFVPASRAFRIAPEHATLPHPIYQYPFLQLADTTLAINMAGMALHFFDLSYPVFFSEAFALKNGNLRTEQIKAEWQTQHTLFMNMKNAFHAIVNRSWTLCEQGHKPEETLLEQVSASSLALAKTSRDAVTRLFAYGGLSFADKAQPINRVWRDINTAGQHSLLVR
ncbi:MAG: acyl-CoA dehydrogenase [Chitinophagaceae bacterium]